MENKEYTNIELENGVIKYDESTGKEVPYDTLLVQIEELDKQIFQHQENIIEQQKLADQKTKEKAEKQFLLDEVNRLQN